MYRILDSNKFYNEPCDVVDDQYQNGSLTLIEKSFLCELLKQKRPQKILEVGTYQGATTCVILNCLNHLGLNNTKLYSIDISEVIGDEYGTPTGYLVNKRIPNLAKNWKLYSGHTTAYFIDEIGNNIDFVILDAAHVLPGELLDFITVLPYVKDSTIIIMHDILLANIAQADVNAIATNVLISSAVGNKFTYKENAGFLSNIGAIEVTDDTRKYIENVIRALSLPWTGKWISKDILSEYRRIIQKNYTEELYRLFELSIFQGSSRVVEINDIYKEYFNSLPKVNSLEQELLSQLKNFENSKSWKITKPLRQVMHIFKKVIKRRRGTERNILHAIYLKIKNTNPLLSKCLKKMKKRHSNIVQNTFINPESKNDYNAVFSKKANNEIDINKIDIAFIVPQPIKGSGGHRNFFRAIKYLHDFGHRMTVYYTQTFEGADIIKQKVSEWFYDMKDIPFIKYDGKFAFHDVCFATWWETVYDIHRNKDKIRFPFYFVQDFEPVFYPMGSNYILAENSYKMGFTHICSGPWCKSFLQREFNAEAEYFQFPLDKNIYNMNISRVKKRKNIIFFAKPDLERRCFEVGIRALKIFKSCRQDIEIILFGSNHVDKDKIDFDVTILNLLPTLNDLAHLYRNADLGIVFSTTNPSLVPYEMMSCGCPVVDFDYDNAVLKYGNDKNNVFLFSVVPEILATQIASIIDNDILLKHCVTNAQKWILNEFPSETDMAKKIETMIINKITTGKVNFDE